MLGTERAALWIEEEAEPHDLVARASFGYSRELDPAGVRRFPTAVAHEWLGGTEPFVLDTRDLAKIEGARGGTDFRYVVAPLKLERNRVGALTATKGGTRRRNMGPSTGRSVR